MPIRNPEESFFGVPGIIIELTDVFGVSPWEERSEKMLNLWLQPNPAMFSADVSEAFQGRNSAPFVGC